MAIPDDIHPLKLILACLGIDARRRPPSLLRIVQRFLRGLELPPTHALFAMDLLRTQFAPLEKELTKSETFLNPHPLIANAIDIVTAAAAAQSITMEDLGAVMQNWLSSLKIDTDTFGNLVAFSMGRLQAACYPANTRPVVLRDLDAFCDQLIEAAPEAFRAAHNTLVLETLPSDTPLALGRQQAFIRPLHHLMESEQRREVGKQHSALIELLQAWDGAAETSIYSISKFICILRDPATSTKKNPEKKKRHKGDEFKIAREWCKRHDIQLPFLDDTYTIRNAIAHKSFTINDSDIAFRNEDGSPLATLTVDDIRERVHYDTLLAVHFINALVGAEFRYRNRSGEFDEAWATAKSRIPNLAMSQDDGTPWPNRANKSRVQRRRVFSFKTSPIRSRRTYDPDSILRHPRKGHAPELSLALISPNDD